MISDAEFSKILDSSWDQFCFVAYDGYKKHGKGLVALNILNGEFKLIFTHPAEGHIRDAHVLEMVNSYDPEIEFLVQYPSNNNLAKTVRVEVDGENPPSKVWQRFSIGE